MKNQILSLLSLVLLAGCSNVDVQPADPNPTPHDMTKGAGVFSKDGNLLSSFNSTGKSSTVGEAAVMNVNPYLWRSSLQAISFMPLTQADSAGGVILSDWMSQETNSNKQVKVNIYILGKKLEPTALNVKVFEKTKQEDGTFSGQKLDKATSTALEETILSNARRLKIKALAK